MSQTSILTALSLLTCGSLALTGCDKDRPATEVPAAAGEPMADEGLEDLGEDAEDMGETDEMVESEPPAEAMPHDLATALEPAPPETTFASMDPEPDPEPEAAAEPRPKSKPKPKPKPKRNKRAKRGRSTKGEAACGEGTCG